MYLSHERRSYILRLLEERGNIRAAAVARELGVTDETVRNDLILLEKKGLLKRVHGGAVYQMPIALSTGEEHNGPTSLGAYWANKLLPDIARHATLYIEYSSHAMALVARLAQTPCTIVGNHPRLLAALKPASISPRCALTGGYYDKQAGIFAGPEAQENALRLKPDMLVLTPDAFSPEEGCGYRHRAQADMAAALAGAIGTVVVLCPTERFRTASLHTTGPFSLHRLMGEDNMPEADRALLLERGIALDLAPAASPL